MNKNIIDDDRIIIGVREWAVDTVFIKGFGLDRWLLVTEADKKIDAKVVVEIAQELEEYVLGGIVSKEATV